jgi:hypothetical protein
MEHPFEVGKMYRNRAGEYEVVGLDGPRMVIRYTDGSVLRTRVAVQARIWQNIQLEASLEREKQRAASQTRLRRRGGPRGADFQGLEDHDFQEGVGGTSWRARTSLGGRLAQRMTDITPYFFQSYAIYRRAVVHVAAPTHYDTKTRWREAKFAFGLDTEQARFGFYIEKNEGPMDSTWHWPNMVEALHNEASLQQEIESAMRRHKLQWELYVWAEGGMVAQVRAAAEALRIESQDREVAEPMSWLDFVALLRRIGAENWADLHLRTYLPKDTALAAGAGLVALVTEAYRALLPLYEACTRQGRFAKPAQVG